MLIYSYGHKILKLSKHLVFYLSRSPMNSEKGATMNYIDERIKNKINQIIDIRRKIEENSSKIDSGDVNPFFLALFGRELALQTKIGQSLQTTLGMSFNEHLCGILAENYGYDVKMQYKLKGFINDKVSSYLTNLLEAENYNPDRLKELKDLKIKVKKEDSINFREYPDSTVDIFLKKKDSGKEFYIDITSSKPNKKEIRAMKRKLLQWTALRWSQDPDIEVESYLGVPHALDRGLGGSRYMHKNLLDRKDILVGDELFNLLSEGNYSTEKIENILEEIGVKFQKDLDQFL